MALGVPILKHFRVQTEILSKETSDFLNQINLLQSFNAVFLCFLARVG